MCFFSVIIPVYNREDLIHEALDSVFAQTFQDFEVIVVDDGSTDGTVDALQAYPEPVRIIEQENAGPGMARNTGIEAAEGTYVAFLDSDDRWFPWTLSSFHKAVHDYDNPSFVTGKSISEGIHSYQKQPFTCYVHKDYLATSSKNIQIFGCTCVVKRHLLEKVGGFSPRNINGEDSDLWMKLGTADGFVQIASPSIHIYRRHTDSAVSNLWRSYLGGIHMIQHEKKGCYPGGKERQLDRLRIITRHLRPKTLRLMNDGAHRKAWLLYKHTFRWNLELRRFRFLVGFPALFAAAVAKERLSFVS